MKNNNQNKLKKHTSDTTFKSLSEPKYVDKDAKKVSCLNQDQFKHIHEIRERYGIGVELNEQTRTVTNSLKGSNPKSFCLLIKNTISSSDANK